MYKKKLRQRIPIRCLRTNTRRVVERSEKYVPTVRVLRFTTLKGVPKGMLCWYISSTHPCRSSYILCVVGSRPVATASWAHNQSPDGTRIQADGTRIQARRHVLYQLARRRSRQVATLLVDVRTATKMCAESSLRRTGGGTAGTRKRQNNINFLTFRFSSKSRQKRRDFNITTSFSDRKILAAEP